MLEDFSEDMKLSEKNDGGAIVAMDRQEPLDIAAAVSLKNVLFFFSLVFRFPREAVHKELDRMLPLYDDFLNAYAGNAPELPEVTDLQTEYNRLFVKSRGSSAPVAPYASCHLNGRILKGESFHRLCQIMNKTGFVPDGSVGELEDHLAILLEFGSMLTDRLIEASVSGGTPMDEIVNIFGEVTARYLRPLSKATLAGVSKRSVMDFYAVSTRALYNFLVDVEKIYAHVFGVSVVAARKRVRKRQFS